jgi:DinB superfamily
MASIWVESVGRSLEQALDLVAAAVRDCTDELWETTMWQVPAPDPDQELLGPDEKPVTDPAQRRALIQRHSTPWAVA